MRLGVAPQTLLAAYRVADSPVNALTPLMVYLPFIVTIAQRYQKKAGIGTVVALMLPYSVHRPGGLDRPVHRVVRCSASRSGRATRRACHDPHPGRPPHSLRLDGKPPGCVRFAALVAEAHERYRDAAEGRALQVYPALAGADPGLFGVCVVGVDGAVFTAGDADVPFTDHERGQAVRLRPRCRALGARTAAPTGSASTPPACRSTRWPRSNARSTAGPTRWSIQGPSPPPAWCPATARRSGPPRRRAVSASPAGAGGRRGDLRVGVGHQPRQPGRGPPAARPGLLGADPDLALDLYTRQSCLRVTARDLAMMGATLADGGVNPVTGERVIDEDLCHSVLAVMLTAGLYETSGDWLYEVGLPGKSGIGGGIVTVSPGKGGLGHVRAAARRRRQQRQGAAGRPAPGRRARAGPAAFASAVAEPAAGPGAEQVEQPASRATRTASRRLRTPSLR